MYKRNLLQKAYLLVILLPLSLKASVNNGYADKKSILISEHGFKAVSLFYKEDTVKNVATSDVVNKEEIILNSPKIDMGIKEKGLKNPAHVDSFSGWSKQSGGHKSVLKLNNAHPLIYIDGKEETQETMRKIKPEDIEKIEVLKDKNATDKFGEKGKNGVIVITLKNKE